MSVRFRPPAPPKSKIYSNPPFLLLLLYPELFISLKIGCSSAITLIKKRVKLHRQQRAACPDMIRQSRRHSWWTLLPRGMNQSGSGGFPSAQRCPQTLMRAREVVKGVKEDDASTHLLPVCAEAPTLADQRSPGMTPCQGEPFHHTGAARQAARRKAGAPTPHALRHRLETPRLLLLDGLRVDHVRMRFAHRFAGVSPRAWGCALLALTLHRPACRQGTTETSAEQPGVP